jgi:hypothetical protein
MRRGSQAEVYTHPLVEDPLAHAAAAADDLLSLFIYYFSSHVHSHTANSQNDPCNGFEAVQMPSTHKIKPASLPHTKYQAKAADECLTSIRRVVITWQMKWHSSRVFYTGR